MVENLNAHAVNEIAKKRTLLYFSALSSFLCIYIYKHNCGIIYEVHINFVAV